LLTYVYDVAAASGNVRVLTGPSGATVYSMPDPFAAQYLFGYHSVAGARGDVDGDEFPDFLVGSPTGVPGLTGRADLISGAPVGLSTFGTACVTASGDLPRIAGGGVPSLGAGFAITLSRVDPGLEAILFFGLSRTSWGGLSLPYGLGGVGMSGCDLLVSVEASIGTTTVPAGSGQGAAKVSFVIPNNPMLPGLSIFSQWLVLNPPGSPMPGATTKGLQITFQ
jgi:hypothetical protein